MVKARKMQNSKFKHYLMRGNEVKVVTTFTSQPQQNRVCILHFEF